VLLPSAPARWQTPLMPGVRIVTDSACDLTDQLVKEHAVIVVPLTIRFGEEEFEDRRQLSPDEFWVRCQGKAALPETAAPSPGSFVAAYQQAVDEGADAVLCLTISSGVSGTYASAVTAAGTFTGAPVRVVDTRSLTMGQGLLVLAAAEDAAAGMGLDELEAATVERAGRVHVYGVLGGLDFLQRGGRIGGAQALLGSLLSIKPVIQVKDGEVAEESKQRTRSRALAYMTAKVAADTPLEWLAVADGACDDIVAVQAQLTAVPVEHPPVSVQLGPVVGSHTGPNTVGICYIVAAAPAGGGE
jgi:DegV family protein with EDD domain